MEKIPVRDQGNVDDCYAMTTATGIDAWRLSSDPDNVSFLTSPHAVALSAKNNVSKVDKAENVFNLTKNKKQAVVDFHNIGEAVRAVKKDGVCSYDAFGANFSKEGQRYGTNTFNFWVDLTEDYKALHHAYISALIKHDSSAEQKALAEAADRFTEVLCRAGFSDDQSRFQNLADLSDVIAADDAFVALKKLSDKVCAGHTAPLPKDFPNPVAVWNEELPDNMRGVSDRKKVYSKVIDAMFDFKKRQPLMISYCDQVLKNFGYIGLNKDTGHLLECSNHASLIIGRGTMPDGRCGFLIRNSWGTDRDGYHGITSQIDDNGDIMIPEDALYNNLISVSVLPPRGEKYKAPRNVYEGIQPEAKSSAPQNGGGMTGGSL
jgi:hypothetical protein